MPDRRSKFAHDPMLYDPECPHCTLEIAANTLGMSATLDVLQIALAAADDDQAFSLTPPRLPRRRGRTWLDELDAWRDEHSMTKQQLADWLKIHRTTMFYWEKGKSRPTPGHAEIILEKTGIDIRPQRADAAAYQEL